MIKQSEQLVYFLINVQRLLERFTDAYEMTIRINLYVQSSRSFRNNWIEILPFDKIIHAASYFFRLIFLKQS